MVAAMRCLDCESGWDAVGIMSETCADCGSENVEVDNRVWVREPCPTCGATTSDEADRICKPIVHCPASEVDDGGYLIWLRYETQREET